MSRLRPRIAGAVLAVALAVAGALGVAASADPADPVRYPTCDPVVAASGGPVAEPSLAPGRDRPVCNPWEWQ
jgi:hypothetical protein